jgi:predicted phage tail protein
LNKNIILLRDYGYEWCSFVSLERDTICLWEKESGEMGIILSDDNKIVDIADILENKMDLFQERTQKIKIASNKELLKKCRELSKQSMVELRNEAAEKEIEIEDSEGKKLNKQELVDNLLRTYQF